MGLKTAVAFLVFNRPDTTAQVFAAIRQAAPETLLVVADGPRPGRSGEAEACAQVRTIVEQIDWPCRVLRNYADVNMGCKGRVSSGLDWVFSEVEEAIILEDDCLPDPSFFPFCEKMLDYYRHDERVMMIGGMNYLLDRSGGDASYFFTRYYAIWGWASWRRAWQKYDIAMKEWPLFRKDKQLREYYADAYMRRHLTRVFDDSFSGRIDTWDNQWFYTCLFNNGLSIVPRVNLITNIGVVGAHASAFAGHIHYPSFPLDTATLVHPAEVCPDVDYERQFFGNYFKPTVAGLYKKIKGALRKRGLLPR